MHNRTQWASEGLMYINFSFKNKYKFPRKSENLFRSLKAKNLLVVVALYKKETSLQNKDTWIRQ